MASVTRRLLLQSAACPARIRTHHIPAQCAKQWRRPLSSTVPRYEDSKGSKKDSKASKKDSQATSKPDIPTPSEAAAKPAPETSAASPKKPTKPKKTYPRKPTAAETEAAMLASIDAELHSMDASVEAEETSQGKRGIQWASNIELTRDEDFEIEKPKGRPGFWAEGEEALGPDEDYFGDDITSHGHGELEQHRELREYARLIAWELPLLHQLARPFELPTAATPFRFRYTSYLGESHPATNKVVVEFSASDMPNLSPLQKSKLIKLAGPRYNPSTDIIKMSCELFDTLPQNKRFLGDTIAKLLSEARDGKDTFEDVPFDFRHHKPKKRVEFPAEWFLTEERKRYLEEKRERARRLDEEKVQNGVLVDGKKIVETSLPFMSPVAEPVMVGGPRGKMLR